MSFLWDELDKEEEFSINQRVARAFLADSAGDVDEAQADAFAQTSHKPTYTNNKGSHQSACSCGWTSSEVHKNNVKIDDDYTNPENTFTDDEVERARGHEALKAVQKAFTTHSLSTQKDETVPSAEDIDIRHSDDISEAYGDRDLTGLIDESGETKRLKGQQPIEDSGRELRQNDNVNENRSGINRSDVLKTKTVDYYDKLNTLYNDENATMGNPVSRLNQDITEGTTLPDEPGPYRTPLPPKSEIDKLRTKPRN